MELINENDLQNVCGGMNNKVKSAGTAAGTLLLVCGIALLAICDDDFRIEAVIGRPVATTTKTTTTTTTQTTYITQHCY